MNEKVFKVFEFDLNATVRVVHTDRREARRIAISEIESEGLGSFMSVSHTDNKEYITEEEAMKDNSMNDLVEFE